jgi:hypothetical protein
MIVREIVVSCSNPHVASAAVASIGGDFARRFERDAANRNLSSGMLASCLVRDFARRADDSDWKSVGEATRGADTPILSGLRYILERGLELGEDEDPASSEDWPERSLACVWPMADPSARCGEAWRNCE